VDNGPYDGATAAGAPTASITAYDLPEDCGAIVTILLQRPRDGVEADKLKWHLKEPWLTAFWATVGLDVALVFTVAAIVGLINSAHPGTTRTFTSMSSEYRKNETPIGKQAAT